MEGHLFCAEGSGLYLIHKSPGGTGNEVLCGWSVGKDVHPNIL